MKIEFDKKKYITDSVFKVIIALLVSIIVMFIFLMYENIFNLNSVKTCLLIIVFCLCIWSLKLYYNYLLFKEFFFVEYKKKILTIEYARSCNFLESCIKLHDLKVYYRITVKRLDSIERNNKHIMINGHILVDKKFNNINSKIYDHYKIPAYITNIEKIKK